MTSAGMGDARIAPSAGKRLSATRAVKAVKRPKATGENGQEAAVTTKKGEEEEQTSMDSVPETEESSSESQRPAAATNDRHALGVRRLDDLLDGGLRYGSFTLLYGAPFLGKEHLSRMYTIEALRDGMPAIVIHTDITADEAQAEMVAMDPDVVSKGAQKGLLQHIDCYSRPIEASESKAPNVRYVDGPMDLNGISLALNEAQRKLQGDHDHHVLVIDNLSTIIAYSNAQTAFRFLQVLLGKGRRVGATTLVLMDQGMHSEAEVQMFRHLMTGSIDVRDHNGKFQLKVLGISNQEGLSWIDYRYHQGRFQVTGSFAPGRIR